MVDVVVWWFSCGGFLCWVFLDICVWRWLVWFSFWLRLLCCLCRFWLERGWCRFCLLVLFWVCRCLVLLFFCCVLCCWLWLGFVCYGRLWRWVFFFVEVVDYCLYVFVGVDVFWFVFVSGIYCVVLVELGFCFWEGFVDGDVVVYFFCVGLVVFEVV